MVGAGARLFTKLSPQPLAFLIGAHAGALNWPGHCCLGSHAPLPYGSFGIYVWGGARISRNQISLLKKIFFRVYF